jgi:MFS family permease
MKTPWKKLYILSFAGAISWMGSSLTTFAVILRDKDTVGAGGISGYLLVFAIPTILMAPVSGLIADRFSSRTVLMPCLTIMGLSSFSLSMGLPLWWTPIALFITACVGALVGPAWQAAEVSVTAPEDRARVEGLMQSTSVAGSMFAPALGGILISTTGYFWPFIIDGISFWLLGVVWLFVNINRKPVVHEEGEKNSAMAGLQFVMADQLIRSMVILVAVIVIALGSVNVGEVFLAQDELGANEFIYGIISMLFAGGSIVGSLGTAALKLPLKFHARAVVISLVVLTATVLSMSLAWHWWVLMVLSVIAGLGNSVLNAYAVGIIMTKAPQDKLGRILAAIGAVIQTGSVAGIVIAGQAISLFGVRNVLMVGALISAVVVFVLAPAVLRAGREHRIEEPKESAEPIAQDTEPQR